MTLHVVTGASRGLGAAMVRQLLREGHEVVAAARGPAPAGVEDADAARLHWTSIDLGDPEAARQWVVQAVGACSHVDGAVLVLNAGMLEPVAPVAALDAAALDAHMRLNLLSPMLVTAGFLQATAASSRPRRILAVSSGAARRGVAHWGAYCAAKAGLDGFVRALNAEGNADASVRAVSLAPGVIDTAMQAAIRGIEAPSRERFLKLHADGQLATAEDAAAALLSYLRRSDFGSHETDDIRMAVDRLDQG